MLNIRIYLATVAVLSLAGYGWGLWQHQTGWRDGREALIAEQAEAACKAGRVLPPVLRGSTYRVNIQYKCELGSRNHVQGTY